jgi:hypothetical protein
MAAVAISMAVACNAAFFIGVLFRKLLITEFDGLN